MIGMLAVHRTMGHAWQNILDYFIEERGSLPAAYLFKALEVMHKGQRIMAREQLDHCAELQHALEENGVRSALLKGTAMVRMGFRSAGMRVFNDNDLLVERSQLTEASQVLKRLGYVQGSWNYAAATVRRAARRDIVLFPIHSHQTHPYMRPTPQALTLECHRLDLHFSVDLLTSNRTDKVVSELLARRVPYTSPTTWTLHRDDMFIFGCVHYYKEATHRDEVERLKDLVLYKLVDLLELLENPQTPVCCNSLVARTWHLKQQASVYFALDALDQLFPGRVPSSLLTDLAPSSRAYLDEVADASGAIHRWQAPLVQRFFNPHRMAELAQ